MAEKMNKQQLGIAAGLDALMGIAAELDALIAQERLAAWDEHGGDMEQAAWELLAELDRPESEQLPLVREKLIEKLRECAKMVSTITNSD